LVYLPVAGRHAESMYFVYIIKLRNGSFYKGMTSNLEKRLQEQRNGKCRSTKSQLPFICIHSEQISDRITAREREKFFKSGQGRDLIKKIDKARVVKLVYTQS